MNSNVKKSFILIVLAVIASIAIYMQQMNEIEAIIDSRNNVDNQYSYFGEDENTFKIISSTENKDLEAILENFAINNNIDIDIDYAGTIEIMEKLNSGEKYDAVWTSNSIWMYMLDSKAVSTSDSKSTSINPVVFGIKKSKAQELDLIGKEIYTKDIVNLIKERKIKI